MGRQPTVRLSLQAGLCSGRRMPEPKGRPMKKHLIWMTAVFALVAAACGGDDGGGGDTSAPTDPRG